MQQVPISVRRLGLSQLQLIDVPDACPICHAHIEPLLFSGVAPTPKTPVRPDNPANPERIEILFQCTQRSCERAFVAICEPISSGGVVFEVVDCVPKEPRLRNFESSIEQVSPSFVDIYNQAMAAEAAELEQLVGIGLRKALEFLIKDYAISRTDDDAKRDAILKANLGQVIQDFVAHPTLKATAKRAAWLGNDETHYTRLWNAHDIDDLKSLIALTVAWVHTVVLSDAYVEAMPDKNET